MEHKRKKIVLSIKPIFSDEIYKGNKRIELRRCIGVFFESGSEILIYSTSPEKAITGSAKIHHIDFMSVTKITEQYLDDARIDLASCEAYFQGKANGYMIWLTDVKRYREPLHMQELKQVGFTAPQSFSYATRKLIDLVNNKC